MMNEDMIELQAMYDDMIVDCPPFELETINVEGTARNVFFVESMFDFYINSCEVDDAGELKIDFTLLNSDFGVKDEKIKETVTNIVTCSIIRGLQSLENT